MAADEIHSDSGLTDPWTPDQETALLKALVYYKPVGLHAHFRMLSIRNHLLNSGTIDADSAHTRIPGIWMKIKSLYDIEELNEREDEVFTSLDDDLDGDEETEDAHDEDETAGSSRRGRRAKKAATTSAATAPRAIIKPGYWRDFELPAGADDNGFEALMWERRLNPEGTPDGSDWDTRSQSRTRNGGRDATEEPRSSPVGRGTRSGRKGRVSKLKDEMDVDSPTSTRGSRRASKAASEAEADDDEDHHMEDAEEEDGDEGDEGEEDDSEDADDADDDKKPGASKRGRGGGGRATTKRGRRRK